MRRCWPREEALRIHQGIGDRVGTGLSQMRMCGVLIQRNSLKEAEQWCDRAELTLSQTSGMDDNDYRTLAALRGRLYLALGRSKEAVAQFDRAIAPGRRAAGGRHRRAVRVALARARRGGRLPGGIQRPGRVPAAHARTGHARSHSRSGAIARAVRERPGKAEDHAAGEGRQTRRGAAQQPAAHHPAGGDRRPHRPGDRVLPRLRPALESPASRRADPPRGARRAHRTAQSARHRAQGGRTAVARPRSQGHTDHRTHRPGSFQVDQRSLRARGGRPAPAAPRDCAAHRVAHPRSVRSLWRRRIPGAVPGHHPGAGAAVSRAAARRAARPASCASTTRTSPSR